MKTLIAATAVAAAIMLAPAAASAGERMGDGLMGAGAGLLVGGPVGAVAGGVIGYTAGPHISRGMGFHRHRYHRHSHYQRTRASVHRAER